MMADSSQTRIWEDRESVLAWLWVAVESECWRAYPTELWTSDGSGWGWWGGCSTVQFLTSMQSQQDLVQERCIHCRGIFPLHKPLAHPGPCPGKVYSLSWDLSLAQALSKPGTLPRKGVSTVVGSFTRRGISHFHKPSAHQEHCPGKVYPLSWDLSLARTLSTPGTSGSPPHPASHPKD